MIKVGSRVKFISDTGEGIVRAVEGELARVEIESGFEIPTLLSDLIAVEAGASPREAVAAAGEGSGDVMTGRGAAASEMSGTPSATSRPGRGELFEFAPPAAAAAAEPLQPPWELTDYLVELLFVPVSDAKPAEGSELDLYLVNDSSYALFFHIGRRDERRGYVRTIASGSLEADSKLRIKRYSREELAEVMSLHVGLLPYKATTFTPRPVEAFDLELHPLQFARGRNFVENDYFDLPAVEFVLATSSTSSSASSSASLEGR